MMQTMCGECAQSQCSHMMSIGHLNRHEYCTPHPAQHDRTGTTRSTGQLTLQAAAATCFLPKACHTCYVSCMPSCWLGDCLSQQLPVAHNATQSAHCTKLHCGLIQQTQQRSEPVNLTARTKGASCLQHALKQIVCFAITNSHTY